jgi:3-deoxy-7-phosphoheptulonate synthase
VDHAVNDILDVPALQQPDWSTGTAVEDVREMLSDRPALIDAASVRALRSALAEVASGHRNVIQAGDCAEDPDESTADQVARKASLLDMLALTMKLRTNKPVLRVGRMAGQFGKPRSKPFEQVDGVDMPVYRGHMVNTPEPDPDGRRPRTDRMLSAYSAASDVVDHLERRDAVSPSAIDSTIWTSHEALVLDYELPMVRRDENGQLLLTSTHWPWIGERTRQLDGAHVDLLSRVVNPIGCKVGPSATPEDLVALCDRLDPGCQPGRLTLMARLGADAVAELLPPLVAAVKASGHPVIWLTDPMHGNTVSAPGGLKTRFVEAMVREVENFQVAVHSAGGTAGGVHLETTPDHVTECVQNEADIDSVGGMYTSLCDPRLNPSQAVAVVSAWTG